MLPVALEDPLGVLVGGKEGIREVKTGDTNENEIVLVYGRDRPIYTDQRRVLPNMSIMIGGVKS